MNRRNAGFTIIELMIATLVFSVILLIITSGIISLTNQYFKGVTSTNTQTTARAVMDAISQDIQFSGATPTATQMNAAKTLGYFCTGTHLYTYELGMQLTDGPPNADQTNNALVQSNLPNACPSAAAVTGFPASTQNPRELLTPHMRLANLVVKPSAASGSWVITVRIASGDSETLTNPIPLDPVATPTMCKSGGSTASQFCAISELTTTVQQRLNDL
jgi:prepilin-type N-terminal cleavage/methylation domain-containing protein